jgi:hypothetical protein
MIRPEHPFDIRPDLRKAASTKAISVIRPNQLVRSSCSSWFYRKPKITLLSLLKLLFNTIYISIYYYSYCFYRGTSKIECIWLGELNNGFRQLTKLVFYLGLKRGMIFFFIKGHFARRIYQKGHIQGWKLTVPHGE